MRAIMVIEVLLGLGLVGLHLGLRPSTRRTALEPSTRAEAVIAEERQYLRSRARAGEVRPVADDAQRVAVEGPPSFEARMEAKYAGWNALRMLQEGQVLGNRVVGTLHGSEPEAHALRREALWLLEQGTLVLRREAEEWERGRATRSDLR